jgi:hypothetical protein
LIRGESDAFVGIYAHRYGHIPKGDRLSLVEAEYRAASKAGLTRLIYLVDPGVPWVPAHIDTGRPARQLRTLKERLQAAHVCKTFVGKDDLASSGRYPSGATPGTPTTGIRGTSSWHTLRPSSKKGQLFDIAIYLVPHRSNDPRHRRDDLSDVTKAEFFLGQYWGNRVIPATAGAQYIGITTSAYGPFLCICRVRFRDGGTAVLSRYIDFEMSAGGPGQTRSVIGPGGRSSSQG